MIYYLIFSNGDGSCQVEFFKTKREAVDVLEYLKDDEAVWPNEGQVGSFDGKSFETLAHIKDWYGD